jgi:hypothetical protein
MGYELKEQLPTPPELSSLERRCSQPAVSAPRQTQQGIMCCHAFRQVQRPLLFKLMVLPEAPPRFVRAVVGQPV